MSMVLNDSEHVGRLARERSERRQYRMFYALAFPLCFGAALVSRIIGQRQAGTPKSILRHAKALAGATVPMVFMG
jgi:hypothetical protein